MRLLGSRYWGGGRVVASKRDDIANWRNDFLSQISKEVILTFAKLYVQQKEL